MKKQTTLIPLFKTFIRDTQTGKRLKKNGEKIKSQSIQNYIYVLKNLINFEIKTNVILRICDVSKLNKREYTSEKNYWKKFYKKFTEYLYANGCHDNYVGTNIKVIRTFFNYLKNDRDFFTGDFQRLFYVRSEDIEILVLSPEQLKFLIHDNIFEDSLPNSLQRIKDIFVFGCTTGLRFSDVFLLTNKNFEQQAEDWYLKVKSKKTKTFTFIKLSNYAIDIYKKYKSRSNIQPLFTKISLFNFNKHLKRLGMLAEFNNPIEISREMRGKTLQKDKNKQILFYEKMSSHMMRRTAITTLLILGMPEHLVRKMSGHSHSSNSFNRYVHYAQSYMDREIDKVHNKLEQY
ncbi:tyrosine-type recombinase/integrase [Psychroserpens burtonensis]|uniref:tyrosine-type recombinase/integrase n=1 Tax=Psychroserpens burtonensis TaxID=49278 RepID=UPI0004101C25|nr:tyrosine-type recombinase/integrase [Psychroserpens burtonensis]